MKMVEMRSTQREEKSKFECVELQTGSAVWLSSSLATHLRQIELTMRSTLSCRGTISRSLATASSLDISFGKLEECFVKRSREMRLEI